MYTVSSVAIGYPLSVDDDGDSLLARGVGIILTISDCYAYVNNKLISE